MAKSRLHDEQEAALTSNYEDYAAFKGWSAPFQFDREQGEAFAGELGTDDLEGKELLEIGFGQGELLAWAQARGAAVAGTEVNAYSLGEARRRGIEILPTLLANAKAAHRGRFDFIVAFDVFEHLALPEIVSNLDACAELLRPDGVLLLRFPNMQSPLGLAAQFGDITHATSLSGDRLIQIAAGTAMEVTSVRGAHRTKGVGVAQRMARFVRYRLQDLVQVFVRFVFASPALTAPIVTVKLQQRRTDGAETVLAERR